MDGCGEALEEYTLALLRGGGLAAAFARTIARGVPGAGGEAEGVISAFLKTIGSLTRLFGVSVLSAMASSNHC